MSDEVTSYRAQIEALEPQETFARAARFDPDAVTKEIPGEALSKMRQAMQPTVRRVEERTGRKFTMEVGEWRTQSRDIIICLAITRTE